jgi:hypothetical protein
MLQVEDVDEVGRAVERGFVDARWRSEVTISRSRSCSTRLASLTSRK